MVWLRNFPIGVLLIVVAAALFPQQTNAAQIRNCGKEIEDDFRKFKQQMRFKGFGRDLTTKKNPKLTQWLEDADRKSSTTKKPTPRSRAGGEKK